MKFTQLQPGDFIINVDGTSELIIAMTMYRGANSENYPGYGGATEFYDQSTITSYNPHNPSESGQFFITRINNLMRVDSKTIIIREGKRYSR